MRTFISTKASSNSIEERELLDYIDLHLSANIRSDYLRFKNDQTLTKTKRSQLLSELKSIVENFYA